MDELTNSPVRCPCGELEELRKAKAELTKQLEDKEKTLLSWKEEYNEAYGQYTLYRDANRQLREDNSQLRRTIVTLCGVVRTLLGDVEE